MGALAPANLPNWPRLVSVEGAANYLSISASTMRTLDIKTRQIGRRVLYDIRDLDRYVDRISDDPGTSPEPGSKPDPAAVAEEERLFFEARRKRRGS